MSSAIEIKEFQPQLAADFARLNLAWLNRYFVVEPIDERMLLQPAQYFIQPGGEIYFAQVGKSIVGTIALLKVSDAVYEVSKMAVDEAFQGQGIGSRLLRHCIDRAKALQVVRLVLYSNTTLGAAIHLYNRFGFKEVPIDKVEYKRASIKMVLEI